MLDAAVTLVYLVRTGTVTLLYLFRRGTNKPGGRYATKIIIY